MNQRGVDPKFLCVRGGARGLGGAECARRRWRLHRTRVRATPTPRSLACRRFSPHRRRNKRFALKGTRKAGQRTKALAANAAKKAQA